MKPYKPCFYVPPLWSVEGMTRILQRFVTSQKSDSVTFSHESIFPLSVDENGEVIESSIKLQNFINDNVLDDGGVPL